MVRKTQTLLAVYCSMLLCSLGNLRAENWPQWRGPRSNGISIEQGIPVRWSKTEQILWRSPMPGQGGATPVVWDERLYVTSADGDDLVLICLDSRTGDRRWIRRVTGGNQDARAGEGNSASPSPCTDGEMVWTFFSTGVLACYDKHGHERWKFDVGERFGKIDIQFGMTSTPVLDGDFLYLQLIHGPMKMDDDHRTGKVIKLDKRTGRTVWEVDRPTQAVFECKHSYASPFIYDDRRQRFLVVHGADCTTGHDLETGRELWRMGRLNGTTEINPGRFDPTFRFVASPAVGDGVIVIPTCKRGPTVALNVRESMRGDLSGEKSARRWVIPQTPDVSIPLIVDGLVYLLHKDGKMQCIDLETGREVYFERTHTVQHRASPLYADGHIYLCGKDGVCTVIRAGREFQIVAKNDLGEPITASPIVANGTLFLRTYDAVYAIGNRSQR